MRGVYWEAEQFFRTMLSEDPLDTEARAWLNLTVAMQMEDIAPEEENPSLLDLFHQSVRLGKVIPFLKSPLG